MPEVHCPRCGSQTKQVKAGRNNGSQQYQCAACRRRYVPERKGRGYPSSLRERAAALRAEGRTLAQIGEALDVTPRTLRNWFHKDISESEARTETADVSDISLVSQSIPAIAAPGSAEANASPRADEIASEWSPARRRVTIHDVAERAGVAASTVSNYLNDKGRMNAGTRERIRDAIDTLHFTPNAMTRAIRKRRTRILGVVAFGLLDFGEGMNYSIIPPLLAGINRSAERAGNDVLLYTSWYSPGSHGGVRFLDGHIDGLLVIGSTLPEPLLARPAAAGLPMVAILTRHVPSNVGFVDIDNSAAVRAVVEHLVSLGRRRIGYYGPVHDSNHIDRFRGFGEAMDAAGLAWDPTPMENTIKPGEFWDLDRLRRGVKRLTEMAELDAIVLPNDWLAAWAVEGLRERGIRVPEDVAVTGFDDVPEAAHIGGGLTTFRPPFSEIGQLAVERLLAMIDGAPVSDCRLTLSGELIVRASTAGAMR